MPGRRPRETASQRSRATMPRPNSCWCSSWTLSQASTSWDLRQNPMQAPRSRAWAIGRARCRRRPWRGGESIVSAEAPRWKRRTDQPHAPVTCCGCCCGVNPVDCSCCWRASVRWRSPRRRHRHRRARSKHREAPRVVAPCHRSCRRSCRRPCPPWAPWACSPWTCSCPRRRSRPCRGPCSTRVWATTRRFRCRCCCRCCCRSPRPSRSRCSACAPW